jgi:uncharacterized membrane protein YgdD (TMEM256/DUF423 family)
LGVDVLPTKPVLNAERRSDGCNWFIVFSGLFGATGVIAGAIGSHVLSARIATEDLEIFSTVVLYLLVHASVLCLCGLTRHTQHGNRWFELAGWLLIVGIILFCGGLITRSIIASPLPGPIAPIGGSALILGWLAIAVGGWRNVEQLK